VHKRIINHSQISLIFKAFRDATILYKLIALTDVLYELSKKIVTNLYRTI
jgi:hypothetical protein